MGVAVVPVIASISSNWARDLMEAVAWLNGAEDARCPLEDVLWRMEGGLTRQQWDAAAMATLKTFWRVSGCHPVPLEMLVARPKSMPALPKAKLLATPKIKRMPKPKPRPSQAPAIVAPEPAVVTTIDSDSEEEDAAEHQSRLVLPLVFKLRDWSAFLLRPPLSFSVIVVVVLSHLAQERAVR
jgi:hypothetical protein